MLYKPLLMIYYTNVAEILCVWQNIFGVQQHRFLIAIFHELIVSLRHYYEYKNMSQEFKISKKDMACCIQKTFGYTETFSSNSIFHYCCHRQTVVSCATNFCRQGWIYLCICVVNIFWEKMNVSISSLTIECVVWRQINRQQNTSTFYWM